MERAREAGRSALGKDPLSRRDHSLLADASSARGEIEKARRRLLRAVELNPNSARDRLNLAACHDEHGDRGLAGYHRARAAKLPAASGAGPRLSDYEPTD